jgi:hypothetical protein
MWDWAIWGALIAAALAGIGALALLATRILAAWRAIKETRRDVVRRLDDLLAKAEATAEKVAAAGDTTELQESLARLRVSRARLTVLRTAIDEAKVTFGRVTAVVPRK